MPALSATRELRSINAAAERYDVNPRTVERWIHRGLITGYRLGTRQVKVDLNEIERNVVSIIPAVAGRGSE